MSQGLNVARIRQLIDTGFNALPAPKKQQRGVLVIGDTGVGKSTVISFLAKKKLVVKHNGLNTVIALESHDDKLKIGHDKYSETAIPTKIVIENLDFYDCSGFNDNRGQEYEISNSFFLQRLFSIYKEVKIFLIIDEHYISEARIDKFPKLIRNLANSFGGLKTIQDGIVLLINRAKVNFEVKDYCAEISKMASLKGEKNFFSEEERNFIEFLIDNKRICILKQAEEKNVGKTYESKEGEKVMEQLKSAEFVKGRHVKNIISEATKLSIRNYIDQLVEVGEDKLTTLCHNIREAAMSQSKKHPVATLQEAKVVRSLVESIIAELKVSEDVGLLDVLSKHLPQLHIGIIQKDFVAVLFFGEIYEKSNNYFTILKHKLISDLSEYLLQIDSQITELSQQQDQFNRLRRLVCEMQAHQSRLEMQIQSSIEEKISISKLKDFEKQQLAQEKQQAIKQFKKLETVFKKKDKVLEEKCREVDSILKEKQHLEAKYTEVQKEKQNEVTELSSLVQRLELENKLKEQEIQRVSNQKERISMQMQTLKELSVSALNISSISKASKYPDIHCPHFKNGGTCKNCINHWKESLKKSLEEP